MENKTKESIASSLELEIEHPYTKIYVSHEGGFIYGNWNGTPTVPQVKQGSNDEIDMMAKHKYGKMIVDTSKVKGTWTNSQSWLMNDWWPRAVAIGFTKIAFIYSPDVFAKFSVDAFVKKGNKQDNPVDQNAFKSFDDAVEWIMED